MTDTTLGTTGDTPTLPISASSSLPPQFPERDGEFGAALARLVDRVPGALPDHVIHTYANLQRTQIRLRQLIASAKRRIATDQKKIAKARATVLAIRRHVEHLTDEIDQKQNDIRRYEHAISAAYSLRSLIEQGELCPKRPQIDISGSE